MADAATWTIDDREVSLTHLDRVLWPGEGITKQDVVEYYRAIAPVMLPHFKDRPVTLRMFHDGISGPGIYRREAPKTAPAWLRRAQYTTVTDAHTIEVPLIDDGAGLIWFANAGAIEFHLWSSHLPELDEPDRVVIDLDPGNEADFAIVLDAALVVSAKLDDLGLTGFPKTSGGHGLHIYLPLAKGYDFETVREWVEELAIRLAADHPGLIAPAHGSTHTGKLVTIDHAQNSIGRNTAAPYTIRARPGAPVSTPLNWDEVRAKKLRPEDFTIRNVAKRVDRLGDLFAPVLGKGKTLPQWDAAG
ncbi:MAG: non-homologous end-joining DNA ligase [Thermomicrobiales bacterium]